MYFVLDIVRQVKETDDVQRSILGLYSRYVEEWDGFPAREFLVRKRAA